MQDMKRRGVYNRLQRFIGIISTLKNRNATESEIQRLGALAFMVGALFLRDVHAMSISDLLT